MAALKLTTSCSNNQRSNPCIDLRAAFHGSPFAHALTGAFQFKTFNTKNRCIIPRSSPGARPHCVPFPQATIAAAQLIASDIVNWRSIWCSRTRGSCHCMPFPFSALMQVFQPNTFGVRTLHIIFRSHPRDPCH